MVFTKEEILDAFESRANLNRIDIEQVPDEFINHMADGATNVDFKTRELLDSFIDEAFKINSEKQKA